MNSVIKLSPVSVQVLVESSVTETSPASEETTVPEALTMLPSMEPSKVEPSVSSSASTESSPTLMLPESF